MEDIEKIAAIAITAMLCVGVTKRGAPEFTVLLVLAAGLCIFRICFHALQKIVLILEELSVMSGMDDRLMKPVFKVTAISIVTKLTADVCRSGGEGGLGSFVETAGTVLSLLSALPLAEEVLLLIAQLLQ